MSRTIAIDYEGDRPDAARGHRVVVVTARVSVREWRLSHVLLSLRDVEADAEDHLSMICSTAEVAEASGLRIPIVAHALELLLRRRAVVKVGRRWPTWRVSPASKLLLEGDS